MVRVPARAPRASGRLIGIADPAPSLYRFYSEVVKHAFGSAADIDAQRRSYWHRSATGLPSHIEFSGFTVAHPSVRRVTDNGLVQGHLHCANVSREVGIEIVQQALAQLI